MAKTVVIVDDHQGCRDGAAAVLRSNGYAVAEAGDGRQALLELLATGPPPDLILLDMLMPVLDGWHVLKHLQKSPLAAVPVVVTTGTILSPEWAKSYGCAGFLKKPFSDEDLLAEVRRCTEPS